DATGAVLIDSHEDGPPEGQEPPPPSMLPSRARNVGDRVRSALLKTEVWPEVPERLEVRSALGGKPAARTRVREKSPGVFLFVAVPVRHEGAVGGVVYAVRSTRPVLVELYRIRAG